MTSQQDLEASAKPEDLPDNRSGGAKPHLGLSDPWLSESKGSDGYFTERRTAQAVRRATLGKWALGLFLGTAALAPHASSWLGHNGDHYYYTSTALQYAGMDYNRALRVTTDYFHYPFPANRLDLGYLYPGMAPLVYPRVVLPVLAVPGVLLLGVSGIYTAGLACGIATLAVLMTWARRRIGLAGLLALPTLLLGTGYASEFMFGIYSEAPLILAVTLMLVAFPLGKAGRPRWRAVAAAGLVPIMMMSRQAPLLPIGMVLGGWLWTWIGSHQARNVWMPFVATVVPTTAVSYWVLSVWAPYDWLPLLLSSTRSKSVHQLIGRLPPLWGESLSTDSAYIWNTDKPLLIFTLLVIVGCVLAIRAPLAGVFLGSMVSGIATFVVNGHPNQFRYLSPSLPMAGVLATLAVSMVATRLTRRAWRRPPIARAATARDPSGPTPENSDRRPFRLSHIGALRLAPIAAATSWITAAALVGVTVAAHSSAPVEGAPSLAVASSHYGRSWPLIVPSGTLICAGSDYEVWFVAPDGTRYPVSGTAMKRSFAAPSLNALMSTRRHDSSRGLLPLLRAGIELCGPKGRSYQKGRL